MTLYNAYKIGINKGIITHQQLSKERHIKQIYKLINDNKAKTRSQLAKLMEISSPAVFSLVDYMISKGIIKESGIDESVNSGRKPIKLALNKDLFQIATIDIHKFYIQYVLYDICCNEIESIYMPVSDNDYKKHTYDIINKHSKKIDFEKLAMVSVGVPAIIGEKSEMFLSTVINMQDGVNLIKSFRELFKDYNFIVGNQSAFYAYAENSINTDKNCLIYINYSYGIGAGIIINGDIFRGADGMAGEIGHMSIDFNGPVCKCGSKGCLERMVNVPAILRMIINEINNGSYSIVMEYCNGKLDELDIDMVAKAYLNKDKLVKQIMDEIAEKFAYGINNIISLYNPDEIVLGGDVEKFGDDFLESIKNRIAVPLIVSLNNNVHIRYTNIEQKGANIGAAKYVLNNIITWSNAN